MKRLNPQGNSPRRQSPEDSRDLYWRVVKGKKNSSLEFLLLGLFSVCIGVFLLLVFFLW